MKFSQLGLTFSLILLTFFCCTKKEEPQDLISITKIENFGNEIRIYTEKEDFISLVGKIDDSSDEFLNRFESSEKRKIRLELFLSKNAHGKCILMFNEGTVVRKKEFNISYFRVFGPTKESTSIGPKPKPYIEKTNSNKTVERSSK